MLLRNARNEGDDEIPRRIESIVVFGRNTLRDLAVLDALLGDKPGHGCGQFRARLRSYTHWTAENGLLAPRH